MKATREVSRGRERDMGAAISNSLGVPAKTRSWRLTIAEPGG